MILQFVAAVVAFCVAYPYLVRFERRVIGRLPLCAPRKWGPLWPLVDAVCALAKPGITPADVRRPAYFTGPLLTLGSALGALALVPFRPAATGGGGFLLRIKSLDVSLLVAFSLTWLGLLGVLLGGWSSGDAYLWRESCSEVFLALRYGLPALLSMGGAIALSASFGLDGLVRGQSGGLPYVVYQPLGLLCFSVSSVVGGRRLPYRLPGGENRLVSDFHLQHAGRVLALYHLAEYAHFAVVSALISTIYLAGWHGPWLDGPHWLVVKALGVMMALLWLRAKWLDPCWRRLGDRTWRDLTLLAVINTLLTVAMIAWRG